jgi:hypothetical protein
LDRLLPLFVGKEEEVFASLVQKYGPEPSTDPPLVSAPLAAAVPEASSALLYRVHAPDKVKDLDRQEEEVFASLVQKYGPEPSTEVLALDSKGSQSEVEASCVGMSSDIADIDDANILPVGDRREVLNLSEVSEPEPEPGSEPEPEHTMNPILKMTACASKENIGHESSEKSLPDPLRNREGLTSELSASSEASFEEGRIEIGVSCFDASVSTVSVIQADPLELSLIDFERLEQTIVSLAEYERTEESVFSVLFQRVGRAYFCRFALSKRGGSWMQSKDECIKDQRLAMIRRSFQSTFEGVEKFIRAANRVADRGAMNFLKARCRHLTLTSREEKKRSHLERWDVTKRENELATEIVRDSVQYHHQRRLHLIAEADRHEHRTVRTMVQSQLAAHRIRMHRLANPDDPWSSLSLY